jgi:hypothetical protein
MYGTYGRLKVPVWASDLTVLRALRKKLKPFSQERRAARKEIFRAILAEHHEAQSIWKTYLFK